MANGIVAVSGFIGDTPIVASLGSYEGELREVVRDIKYRNRRANVRKLAFNLARKILDGSECAFDLVTWIPTTGEHVRERGFDQAELLARAVAKFVSVPFARVFSSRVGGAMTDRSRSDRLRHVHFVVADPSSVRGRRVLLIDDVITTGATVSSAARALMAAGSAEVAVAVVATTPRRIPHSST